MTTTHGKSWRWGAALLVFGAQGTLWTAPGCAQDGARGEQRKGTQAGKNGPGKTQNGAGQNAAVQAQDDFFERVIGQEATKPGAKPELTVLPVAALRGMQGKATNYPIPSGAIFAAPEGKGDGSRAQTPTSIGRAVAMAPVGGVIVLRGGEYRGVSLTLPRKLTLQAYPREKPVFKGSEIVTGWERDGNGWRKSGWAYEFPFNAPPEHLDAKYPLAGLRDMLFVNGDPLVQVGRREDVAPGRFFVDTAADTLVMGDDPTGKVVEATTRPHAFLITQQGATDGAGSALRGLSFEHFADMGLAIAAPRVTVEDSLFLWNGIQGLGLSPQFDKIQGAAPRDCIVRGNTFAGNGQRGVQARSCANLRFENNLVAHNNVENFRQAWAAAGIKIVRTEGVIVRDNVFEENRGTAVWLDISVTKVTVSGNVVRKNGLGIFAELSHDCLVAFNLCQDNNVGVMIADSSQIRVLNNTLVDNKTAIVVKDSPRLNEDKKQIAAGVAWISRDNVIRNNVMAASQPNARLLSAAESWANSSSGGMVAVLDHNLYSAPAGVEKLIRWSPAKGKEGLYHSSLDAFRTASGREAKGAALLLTPQELFVNARGGDFRLRPAIASRYAGQELPADVARALNKPVAPVQLGAF